MTLSTAPNRHLSTDPPQNKEEAVFMFEVGEECRRRALRYFVEVAEMSYGEIVKFAHESNPNSRITKDTLKRLAAKMKADGEPLQTKVPQNFLNAPKRPVRKRTETVENSEPEIEQVAVTVDDPPTPTPTPSAPAPTPTPTPTPTPAPTPTPSVPSAGSSTAIPERWADHPLLDGWNGNLNELSQKIYTREVASSRKRVVIAKQLAEYKLELEKTMNAASKSHRVKAGALLEADVRMVEAKLQEQGRPGIMETLESVRHEAERIYKFATRSLEILQLVKPDY